MATKSGKTYKPYTHVAESNADLVKKVLGRNLQANPADLLDLLDAVGYYRLKGYLIPFYQKGIEVFRPNVKLQDVLTVYNFDRYLREVTLVAIARLEVAMRARIIKAICSMNKDPLSYIKPTTLSKLKPIDHAKLLTRISGSVHQSKNEPFLRYAKEVYGFEDLPPIWTMMEVMSFGAMMDVFKGLPDVLQTGIANEFHVRPTVLRSWLAIIQKARNVCAHHGRLWNRRIQNTLTTLLGGDARLIPLHDCLITQVDPSAKDKTSVVGVKIFSILSIILYCLQIVRPQSSWKSKCLKVLLSANAFIEKGMGFPSNWQTLALWK